jgi:hypothetical protein
MQAIIERAFELGVITKLKRTRMYKTISAQGGRINEPWPLPLEACSQFEKLVRFHYQTLQFTNEEVRRIMFTDRLGQIPVPEEIRLRLVGESESLFGQHTSSSASSQHTLRLPDVAEA